MTRLRETSLQAWKKINESGALGEFQNDVLFLIADAGEPVTPGEIVKPYQQMHVGTPRGRNEIAKRFSELKEQDVIEEIGKRKCRATHFECFTVQLTGRMPKKPPKEEKPTLPKDIEPIWLCEKCMKWSTWDFNFCDCGFFVIKTEAWRRKHGH